MFAEKIMSSSLNVVFVKFGTKYDHYHVNSLVHQLRPYFQKDRFVCYTDNPTSVECECLKPLEKPTLKAWWNKLALFSEEIDLQGECVFFDLDCKINFDPKPFLRFTKNLVVMRDYSKEGIQFKPHAYDTHINSSMMCWRAGEQTHIWKLFLSNKDYFLRKYKGIDRFIWNEDIDIDVFRDGTVNSVKNPWKEKCPVDTWDNLEFSLDD